MTLKLQEKLGIFWQKSRFKLGWNRIHNMGFLLHLLLHRWES
jgi:hypothetical protein